MVSDELRAEVGDGIRGRAVLGLFDVRQMHLDEWGCTTPPEVIERGLR